MTRITLGLALAAVGSLLVTWPVHTADDPPHVVIVSVDGLRPETYTSNRLEVPTLRALARAGAFARGVVGVFPSVTYPSHTTMITGVPPAVHGIYNNRILDPEGRSNGAWYWYAREITAPTLPGAIRARGLTAAVINWPVSVGFEADYLFPEYYRSPHPETLLLLRALTRPASLIDDVQAARGRPLPFPMTDEDRTSIAAFVFRVHRPHLMLLHIFDTDSAQHDFGPDTPQADAAVVAADRHIATLLEAIEGTGLRARTNILVVSDHGFQAVSKQLQLNTLFKQQGWLQVDSRGRITSWNVFFQQAGGGALVMLRDPNDAALRDRVGTALREVAADPANGIARVLTRQELTKLGTDPRASFGLSMQPGFYTGEAHDALLGVPTSKGGHGFDPSLPALHASFVAAGPNIPAVGDLGVVRMTQIAPTVASWFGVGLSPAADVPLTLTRSGAK